LRAPFIRPGIITLGFASPHLTLHFLHRLLFSHDVTLLSFHFSYIAPSHPADQETRVAIGRSGALGVLKGMDGGGGGGGRVGQSKLTFPLQPMEDEEMKKSNGYVGKKGGRGRVGGGMHWRRRGKGWHG